MMLKIVVLLPALVQLNMAQIDCPTRRFPKLQECLLAGEESCGIKTWEHNMNPETQRKIRQFVGCLFESLESAPLEALQEDAGAGENSTLSEGSADVSGGAYIANQTDPYPSNGLEVGEVGDTLQDDNDANSYPPMDNSCSPKRILGDLCGLFHEEDFLEAGWPSQLPHFMRPCLLEMIGAIPLHATHDESCLFGYGQHCMNSHMDEIAGNIECDPGPPAPAQCSEDLLAAIEECGQKVNSPEEQ